MRLVLLGDIHFYRLWAAPWALLGKRLIGHGNLWLNRRWVFDRALLKPTVQRALSLGPELALFSGDLTTTAMPSEFRLVADTLAPLLEKTPALVVPGNHDRYTFAASRRRHMERYFPEAVPHDFPHLRPINARWGVLALNSAVPRTYSSRGRVGPKQLEAVRHHLKDLGRDQGLVLLTHYGLGNMPGMDPLGAGHRLADREALHDLLVACKARILYMHGHVHRPWVWERDEPELDHVTDINAGAPCLRSATHPEGQGFWEIELPEDPAQPPRYVHHAMQRHEWGEGREPRWAATEVPPNATHAPGRPVVDASTPEEELIES